jgi:hypothetical protein
MKIIDFIKSKLQYLDLDDINTDLDKKYTRVQYIARSLLMVGVRANYDPPANDTNRMILYNKDKYRNSEYSECNGLIIDYETLEPLCIPINRFIFTHNLSSGINLDDYQIHKAYDGTIINIYLFNNKVTLSTLRGIDMNAVYWDGISYQEIWDDVKNKYDIDEEKLQSDKSYTICVSHPIIHKCKDLRAICICVHDLKLNVSSKDVVPIELSNLEKSEIVESEGKSHKDLEKLAKESIDAGLIFTYSGSIKNNLPDLYIESNLMKVKRQLLYNDSITEYVNEFKLDREKYIKILSYLDTGRTKTYLELFPNDKTFFEELDKKIINISTNIINGKQNGFAKKLIININRNIDKLTIKEISEYIRAKQHVLDWYYYLWPEDKTSADL